MAKKTLKIKSNDDIQSKETLHKWKRWFNGAKFFTTVHPQPAKLIKNDDKPVNKD